MKNNENETNKSETKVCRKCNLKKQKLEFHKHKNSKDGLKLHCKECTIKHVKENYQKRKDYFKEYNRKYKIENKEAIEIWKQKTKKERVKYNGDWIKSKRKTDINFTIERRLRDHFYRGIRFYKLNKTEKTLDYLGCSIESLLLYFKIRYNIELTVEMIGKGKGKWSIDHIKPISKFDLTVEEEIRICFHYTNLKPMLFEENCKKRSKYE